MKKKISFLELLYQVCYHPKETTNTILNKNPNIYIWPIIIFYSLAQAVSPGNFDKFFKSGSLNWAIFGCLVILPVCGFVFVLIGSCFFYGFGKILGGKGAYVTVRTAYIWALPPVIVMNVMGAFLLNDLFPLNVSIGTSIVKGTFFLFWGLLALLLGIWGWILVCVNLSQAHKLPIWKSVIISVVWTAIAYLIWWPIEYLLKLT